MASPGTYQPSATALYSCSDCLSAHYCPGGREIHGCPAGSYCPVGSATPVICPAGGPISCSLRLLPLKAFAV
eukprot:3940578-Rhodomonas_salina.5